MMAYERSENARDNFGKSIDQFQPATKTLIRKLEKILKLYWQNGLVSLFHGISTLFRLFNAKAILIEEQ